MWLARGSAGKHKRLGHSVFTPATAVREGGADFVEGPGDRVSSPVPTGMAC